MYFFLPCGFVNIVCFTCLVNNPLSTSFAEVVLPLSEFNTEAKLNSKEPILIILGLKLAIWGSPSTSFLIIYLEICWCNYKWKGEIALLLVRFILHKCLRVFEISWPGPPCFQDLWWCFIAVVCSRLNDSWDLSPCSCKEFVYTE